MIDSPSGAHAGVPHNSIASVRARTFVPSSSITHSRVRPCSSTTTRCPVRPAQLVATTLSVYKPLGMTPYPDASYCPVNPGDSRMHMRRFMRLTNAFSKKVENHEAAVALQFVHYNFAACTRPCA